MAADVSSLVRVLSGYSKDDQHGASAIGGDAEKKSSALITRDLLGGAGSPAKLVSDAQELDLDLQVPCGWEKRLDLKSGKVYLQRCNAQNSSVCEHNNNKNQANPTVPKLKDLNLNFPASLTPHSVSSAKTPLSLFDDTSLDLKLVSSPASASASASPSYQSVCTLDKVKSALERAEKEPAKRRSSSSSTAPWKASSPSYSSSSSSMKDAQEEGSDQHDERAFSTSPFAAGCPGCLSYVLIMKNNPKCPRCNSVIPLPLMKKPRIDLNMTI